MTENEMQPLSPELERELESRVGSWLEATTQPLPDHIKDEVVVQAAVVPQRGRWPWQRRSPEQRAGRGFAFAPLTAAVAVVAIIAVGVLLVFGLSGPTDPPVPAPPLTARPSPEVQASPEPSSAPVAQELVVAQDGSGDSTTILGALALAQDGDTIEVRPGTYPEHLYIESDVDIVGQGDHTAVVLDPLSAPRHTIDGKGYRGGILLAHSGASLRNLTVEAGPLVEGPAISVVGGAPELTGLSVRHSDQEQPGLLLIGDGDASVHDNVFHNAVHIESGATPTLRANELDRGLRIFMPGTDPLVEGNTVRGPGSAIVVGGEAEPRLIGNDVAASTTRREAGRAISISGAGEARGNTIHDSDIGIAVDGGWPRIEDNAISANEIGLRLACAAPTAVGNQIEGNGVGIEVTDDCTLTTLGDEPRRAVIRDNRVCDNAVDLRVPDEQSVRASNAPCGVAGADGSRTRGPHTTPWSSRQVERLEQAIERPASGPADERSPDEGDGFVTEPLEAGIVRLLDDGAGNAHIPLKGLGGEFRLAAAPDATVWFYSHGRDELIRFGWSEPLTHPVGPGTFGLRFEPNGEPWVLNAGIATRQEGAWSTFSGPAPNDLPPTGDDAAAEHRQIEGGLAHSDRLGHPPTGRRSHGLEAEW